MTRALALAFCLGFIALPACFSPVSGEYEITAVESSSDCPDTGGDTGGSDEPYTADVSVNDDKSAMTIDDMDCTLDGKSFTCPLDPFELDMSDFGMDALISITFDIGGKWTSSSSFDVESTAVTACDGADCESAGGQNCTSSATSEATLVE